ncbi:MAG: hypothetical protein GX219_06540 [Tissierellia bacterium]|nr:hypothetical protein [Tissierellia bacterium]
MRKLSTKMVIIYAILVFIVSTILTMANIVLSGKELVQTSEDYLKDSAVSEAKYISQYMGTYLSTMEALSNVEALKDNSLSPKEKGDFFKTEFDKHGFMFLGQVDLNGKGVSLDSDEIEFDSSEREYFIDVRERDRAVFSNVNVDMITGNLINTFIAPIKDGSRTVSYLLADIPATELSYVTSDFKYKKTGKAIIIDNAGRVVASNNQEDVLNQKNFIAEGNEFGKFISEVVKATEAGEATIKYNGKDHIIGYAPIEGSMWYILTIVERDDAVANVLKLAITSTILTIILILIANTITYVLSKNIINPVVVATDILKRQADLDFTNDESKVDAISKNMKINDERGEMTRALVTLNDSINEAMKSTAREANTLNSSAMQLNSVSGQTSIAADEIARTVEEIATGATNQAKETESGFNEMSNMEEALNTSADIILKLNDANARVEESKEKGMGAINDLIEKSQRNLEASKVVSEEIFETSEGAKKIRESAEMIQSIAEQTNLLALNAAIEAARAGESGRGFAVVAEEIRKLAENSSKFTEEIRTVVNELTSRIDSAVKAVEDSEGIVREQFDGVEATRGQFEEIAEAISVSNDMISELNQSQEVLNQRKNNMMKVIENLSAIAEENAAGTEETSATVEEQTAQIMEIANSVESLSEVSSHLNDIISKFKL